jgi:hypothetical protein
VIHLMGWSCPACKSEIQYHGDRPQPSQVYRCHVCRLELVTDAHGPRLVVAPLTPSPGRRRAADAIESQKATIK